MPIYEYKCEGCNEVFEVLQKMGDPPPEKHSCGSTHLHRQMSNTSFVLKGGGWYASGYSSTGGSSGSGGGDSGSGSSSKE